MRINHNIQALNAYRQLSQNGNVVSKHLEKLSSGLRINRAADDAAGLAISEKMRSQIRSLAVAERNALDGISLIQTAEGALDSVHSMLQRIRELSVQASNGTMGIEDRRKIQQEVNQLIDQIDQVSRDTEFNTKKLLNGEMSYTQRGSEKVLSTTNNIDVIAGTTITFTIDGVDKTIAALDVVDYDGSTGKTLEDLARDIQNKVDNLASSDPDVHAAEITVKVVNNSILFTSNKPVILKTSTNSLLTNIGVNDGEQLDGTVIHIGANEGQNLNVIIEKMDSTTLGGDPNDSTVATIASLKVANVDSATTGGILTGDDTVSTLISRAIEQVSALRSKLGAFQNRLEYTISNLAQSQENLTAAESRIRDADMALEMTNYTKNNIINQAAQAMLAQANQLPQGVLQLLK